MSEDNRKIVKQIADNYKVFPDSVFDLFLNQMIDALDEAERRGAEKMRERAAKQCEAMRSKERVPEEFQKYDLAFQHAAGAVRALPLEGPKDGAQ